MMLGDIALVFVAGLITALATGLGAIPFFFVQEFSDRWSVALWGIASGIMVAASLFGLINEGLQYATGGVPTLMIGGLVTGVILVEGSDRLLDRIEIGTDNHTPPEHGDTRATGNDDEAHVGTTTAVDPSDASPSETDAGTEETADARMGAQAFADGDLKTLVLILGILTVHSFPEGVAIGVSFARLGIEEGLDVLGIGIPVLAVFMTVAISIHNVPEGTAIAIPMRAMGLSNWRMVGAAVFSSLPQPIGAVIAFIFVRWAESFLSFGFGFAAGAMIYLVVTEFVPEALETGADLPYSGSRALAAGIVAGVALMVPLLYV